MYPHYNHWICMIIYEIRKASLHFFFSLKQA